MISLDDYQQLQRVVEKLRQDDAQAEGAMKQFEKQIKEVSKCSSIKEARAKRDRLTEQQLEILDLYLKTKKKFLRNLKKADPDNQEVQRLWKILMKQQTSSVVTVINSKKQEDDAD